MSWYGLLVGLGEVAAMALVERRAKQLGIDQTCLAKLTLAVLVGGLVGARIWHVLTDWQLYQENWSAIFAFWEGGLSILGAIAGGVATGYFFTQVRPLCRRMPFLLGLDLAVFGLPVGQAIGRIGNYVNQELYGLPTQLPWKIAINPEHRLPGYENQEFYHPLFAYEALALLALTGWLWWSDRHWRVPLGKGWYFVQYLLFYATVRFGLDFLRLEKATLGDTGLSINQLILVPVVVGAIWWYLRLRKEMYAAQ